MSELMTQGEIEQLRRELEDWLKNGDSEYCVTAPEAMQLIQFIDKQQVDLKIGRQLVLKNVELSQDMGKEINDLHQKIWRLDNGIDRLEPDTDLSTMEEGAGKTREMRDLINDEEMG